MNTENLDTLSAELSRYFAPFYAEDDSKRVEIKGTVTYLRLNGVRFIVSAAHCGRRNADKNPTIPGDGKMWEMFPDGDTRLFSTSGEDDDPHDIMVYQVPDHIADDIEKSHAFYDLNRRIEIPGIPVGDAFAAGGFPVTRNRGATRRKSGTTTIPTPSGRIIVLSHCEANDKAYEDPKVSPEVHLVFEYPYRQFLNLEHNKVRAPEPTGMSGGPLFHITPDEDGTGYKHSFAGINTDFLEPDLRVIVARTQILMDCLKKNFSAAVNG